MWGAMHQHLFFKVNRRRLGSVTLCECKWGKLIRRINMVPNFGAKMLRSFSVFVWCCLPEKRPSCSTAGCIGINFIQGSKESHKIIRRVVAVNFESYMPSFCPRHKAALLWRLGLGWAVVLKTDFNHQPLVNTISIKTLEMYLPSCILSYSFKCRELTRN